MIAVERGDHQSLLLPEFERKVRETRLAHGSFRVKRRIENWNIRKNIREANLINAAQRRLAFTLGAQLLNGDFERIERLAVLPVVA